MGKLALFINIGSFIILALGIYKSWILSKGSILLRRVYWLIIIIGIIQFAVNTFLVIRDPKVIGVLILQLAVIWSILMAIKGLKRGE